MTLSSGETTDVGTHSFPEGSQLGIARYLLIAVGYSYSHPGPHDESTSQVFFMAKSGNQPSATQDNSALSQHQIALLMDEIGTHMLGCEKAAC